MTDNELIIQFQSSNNLLDDARSIIDGARKAAYTAINISLVQRNWLLGKRIAEESLQGNDRAVYGLETIKNLSRQLTDEFGKGFTSTDLYWYVRFYNAFPEIFASLSKKSVPLLSWTAL